MERVVNVVSVVSKWLDVVGCSEQVVGCCRVCSEQVFRFEYTME